MNLKYLTSKYIIGNLPPENLPAIAVECLEDGYDSPALIILAGLSKNENTAEMDKYFKQALRELNVAIPDKRLAILQYAYIRSQEIIEGKEDVFWGTMA